MLDRILSKLVQGEPIFGANVSLRDAVVSEMLGFVGLDFLWIDMEHTALTKHDVLDHLIAASSARTASFVRVPWNDPVLVKPILEMGPDGVLFPMIRTADDARNAVRACRYPPGGVRGFGPSRAIRYGMDSAEDYIREGERRFWKIIQIEHVDCVENLEEIARVDGVDCWMIGPYDLSGSIGLLGQVDAPEVQALCAKVADMAARHGIVLGAYSGADSGALKRWASLGVRLFSLGLDANFLMSAARSSLAQAQAAVRT